jgi:hypothetical protein
MDIILLIRARSEDSDKSLLRLVSLFKRFRLEEVLCFALKYQILTTMSDLALHLAFIPKCLLALMTISVHLTTDPTGQIGNYGLMFHSRRWRSSKLVAASIRSAIIPTHC